MNLRKSGSLFNGIWEEIKESTEENIENNIKKGVEETKQGFLYPLYQKGL